MNGYLQMSNKTLASKQASKHYAIIDIGRARCPDGVNPCMGEAKASSVRGFFCLSPGQEIGKNKEITINAD